MTTRNHKRARRPVKRTPKAINKAIGGEMFWLAATLLLIAATVVFVPMLFAAVK